MNAEQWARVKEVFNAALERTPDERRDYVADATADDEPVRREVERLLDAQPNTSDFIEHPAASTLLSGRVISHYEIGRLLGSGGMGRVYAARDTELGREVALKVPSFDGDEAHARLRREAQHASRLSHPHVCHIYEVGRADGQMFVAMELVPGRSLAELIQEGPLPIANARRYGMEIADALAHAHEHGVTHRDLKSTNVIVTPKRGAKVLDFGLARTLDTHEIGALSHSQRSLTDEGLIAGTLPYMAPELLRGQRGDQRADIWALGVLLYEMITGRRPFSGTTGFELSAAILYQPAPALPPGVPSPLRALVQKCLEKNPEERYQHAADVHRALEEMKGIGAPSIVSFERFQKMPRRTAVAIAVLAVGAATLGIILYGLQTAASLPVVSNFLGYSLLEEGRLAEALEQFQGVTQRSPDEANPWDSLGEGYLANGMPEKAFESYSKALAIAPNFEHSTLGRGLALAALGRYDEALATPSPDFRVQAFLLSRVGRYDEAMAVLDKGRQADDDDEIGATALLTAAWLAIEQKQYAPALEHVRAAEMLLADRTNHTLLMLADLLGGIVEIRRGNLKNAGARAAAQKSRYVSEVPVEAKWMAALQAEIALAQGQYDAAASSFTSAQRKVWQILARDDSTLLSINVPSRDGLARVHVARGNRAAAIDEYRRLITPGGDGTSAVVEPRHVLELARLLDAAGDRGAARVEYERFLKLWAGADSELPELTEARQALARG